MTTQPTTIQQMYDIFIRDHGDISDESSLPLDEQFSKVGLLYYNSIITEEELLTWLYITKEKYVSDCKKDWELFKRRTGLDKNIRKNH